MASLIIAAGVFGYDRSASRFPPAPHPDLHSHSAQKIRTKRRVRKEQTAARFSELEKDNATRMARLQSQGYGYDGRDQPCQNQNLNEGTRREGSGSARSSRSSLAEEGPPPPGYEEVMKNREGLKKGLI